MAKDYAKKFYASSAWIRTQAAFMESKNYICERCGDVACIVHHKKHINPRNINDPGITLSWNNLEALCQSCHNKEHLGKGGACKSGLQFNEQGELIEKPPRQQDFTGERRPRGADNFSSALKNI